MRKKIAFAIAIIAIIVVAFIVNKQNKQNSTETALIYTVSKGQLDCYVSSTGSLQAEQSTNIEAPSSIFDREIQIWEISITDIVEEGTVVDSGDYIATLDQNMIQEKIKTLEEELELSYNNLEDARLDSNLTLNNKRDAIISAEELVEEKELILAESKYESPATIQKSKMDKEKAIRKLAQEKQSYLLEKRKAGTKVMQKEIDYERKLNNTKKLSKVLNDVVIVAPQKGMVIYYSRRGVKRTVGSSVSPYSNTIATLPDLSTMISIAYVNEIDISNIKVGQKVDLTVDAFTNKKMEGEVLEIANIGKSVSGSNAKVFEVVIKVLAQDSKLRPEMTTNNTIHTASYQDTILVPSETIFSNDSISYVYVTGKQTHRQIVKLGEQNNNRTIVALGLQEGDKILWSEPEMTNDIETKGWDIYEIIKAEKILAEENAQIEIEKMRKIKSKGRQKSKSGSSSFRIIR